MKYEEYPRIRTLEEKEQLFSVNAYLDPRGPGLLLHDRVGLLASRGMKNPGLISLLVVCDRSIPIVREAQLLTGETRAFHPGSGIGTVQLFTNRRREVETALIGEEYEVDYMRNGPIIDVAVRSAKPIRVVNVPRNLVRSVLGG